METRGGLIYGPEFHHLDHLAPLCSLLGIPLILTEEGMASPARQFYPSLEILHWNAHETPEKLVTQFDTIFYSIPRVLFDQIFFFAQAFQRKRIKTIWCPHGNSDKGRNSRFMEALSGEELLLTYGTRIETFLKEKGINVPTFQIGNYRLHYYEKNRQFYERLIPKKKETTLLYAPTWQDQEQNSSFPKIWPLLLNTPSKFSLLVKLHPNLYLQYPEEIQELKMKAPRNVKILEDFPAIYPILAQTDLYIGDMSSIGYDFLAFKKPMLLLSPSDLTLAGSYLPKEKYSSLFKACEECLSRDVAPTQLYEETFGRYKFFDGSQLKNESAQK